MSKETTTELPKKSFNKEFWVGIFTIVGIGCFAYLAVNIAGMRINGTGYYPIEATFTNIAGLKIGSAVEIAGVKVGEVRGVRLEDTNAVVSLQIREEVKLRDDDIAQIRTKGIIGDKYIKISPGGSDEYLTANSELSDTESAVELEEILGKFIHSLESD